MSRINHHKCPAAPSDPNNATVITAAEVGGTAYTIDNPGMPAPVDLSFKTAGRGGVTSEALLAVVYDRLEQLQKGEHPCDENQTVMGHVAAALHHLKCRTVRLHGTTGAGVAAALNRPSPPLTRDELSVAQTGTVTAHMEPVMTEQPKHRVRTEGDTLFVGSTGFPTGALKSWGAWSVVESAVKALDPPLSPLELEVIEKAAAHLGGGARNGLTELKSALAGTGRPRKPG